MGYLKDTVKGITWMGLLRFVTRVISFAKIAIIARILSPSMFGLYSIAVLVLALLETFTETGINVFLIQIDEKVEKYINTAWLVSILRGFLISFIIFISSSLVARFFKSPDSYPLILLIAVVPFLRGFINPSVVRFQKELSFNKEFYYRLPIFLVEALASVIFVVITKSPFGLIWGLVISVLFELLMSFIFAKPTPRFAFELPLVKQIVSRGKWITSAGIFGYLYENGDNVVVGRMLGASSLGVYDMAYKLSMVPMTEVANIISKVTFPIYAKISGDKARLGRAFLKTVAVTVFLCFPLGLALFLFPKEAVTIILGTKWIQAASVLKFLAILGIIRAVFGSSGALFMSVKKQEYVTVITLVSFLVLLVTIIPLVAAQGIVGAALAALIASILSLPLVIYFLLKIFAGRN